MPKLGLGLGLGQGDRPLGAFDPDASSFFSRAGITDATQKEAVTALVLDLKAASLWSKIVALYPFVGGAATPHSKNLKADQYNITWVNGPTHDANGVTGDGVAAYGDTGFAGSLLTSTDSHLALYSRTLTATALPDAGASTADDATLFDLWCFIVGGDRLISRAFNNTFLINAGVSAGGLIATSRIGDTHTNYRNGTSVGSTSNSANASTGVPNIYIFSYNKSDTPQTFTDTNMALMSIGTGLTDLEMSAYSATVTTFQTALGRNV